MFCRIFDYMNLYQIKIPKKLTFKAVNLLFAHQPFFDS